MITIDEMLAWLERYDDGGYPHPKAIRAILEQHRHVVYVVTSTGTIPTISVPGELAITRAFVERVEKRFHDEAVAKTYLQCARDELASMEEGDDGTRS